MNWLIDSAHSEINFTVRHMMISNVRGRFEKFTGVIDFNEENPANSSVEVKIEASSINTRDPGRDGHLRSADFFDAEKYPYLSFVSDDIEVIDANHAHIHGKLTIKDVTRDVVLDTIYSGQSVSPYGTTNAGFTASTKISRKNWGLNWNVSLETGGWLVSDEVKIDLELEIIKQAEKVAA